jgi:hypothetical protein
MKSKKNVCFCVAVMMLAITLSAFAQSPSNDAFANRMLLQGLTIDFSGTVSEATLEANDPTLSQPFDPNIIYSVGSIWWSWSAPVSGYALLTAPQNPSDLEYSTEDFAQLGIFATNQINGVKFATDNIAILDVSPVRFAAFPIVAGQTYSLELVGDWRSNVVYNFHLEAATAPIILEQPQPQTISAGGAAFFTVLAPGFTKPGQLQWQHNGVDIPGATSASLQINNAIASDAGEYRALVNAPNPGAITISQSVTLTVQGADIRPEIHVTQVPDFPNDFKVQALGEIGQCYLFQHSTNLVSFSTDYSLTDNFYSQSRYLRTGDEGTLHAPDSPAHYFYALRTGDLAKTCNANMHRIQFAKRIWSVEKRRREGGALVEPEINIYLGGSRPVCLLGGNLTYNVLGTPVTCDVALHYLH